MRITGLSKTFINTLTSAALPIILESTWFGIAVAAEQSESNIRAASSPLLRRQPPGFDERTIKHIVSAVRNFPREVPKLIAFAREQDKILGHAGVLIPLLALAIGCAIFGRVQIARRIKQAFARLPKRTSGTGQVWLTAVSEVLAASLLPISM